MCAHSLCINKLHCCRNRRIYAQVFDHNTKCFASTTTWCLIDKIFTHKIINKTIVATVYRKTNMRLQTVQHKWPRAKSETLIINSNNISMMWSRWDRIAYIHTHTHKTHFPRYDKTMSAMLKHACQTNFVKCLTKRTISVLLNFITRFMWRLKGPQEIYETISEWPFTQIPTSFWPNRKMIAINLSLLKLYLSKYHRHDTPPSTHIFQFWQIKWKTNVN